MSHPITSCLIAEALKSEEGYERYLYACITNKLYGHYTSCYTCTVECGHIKYSIEENEALNQRVINDQRFKDAPSYEDSPRGTIGPVGRIDKVHKNKKLYNSWLNKPPR